VSLLLSLTVLIAVHGRWSADEVTLYRRNVLVDDESHLLV
jgi:hypothetical protein